MKKIIVIFLGGYLPAKKYGGPITSIENFTNYMSEEYKILIISGEHDFNETKRLEGIKKGWNSVGAAEVIYIPDKKFSYSVFNNILKEYLSDICMFYLSSVYFYRMNFAAIKLAKMKSIPVVLAPRGDLMKNTIAIKSIFKKNKKLLYLYICKILHLFEGVFFQSTSREETEGLHKYLNIKDNHIFQIENFPIKKQTRGNYYKHQNCLKLLFISRLMEKKNPYYALDVLKSIKTENKITFDIYGPEEDLEYWGKCKELINEINEKKYMHISYKGAVEPSEAKELYKQYDCMFFPTLSENYGHVIAEALLSGCPVLVSKGTTPFDDIDSVAGFAVDLNNKEGFVEKICEMAEMDNLNYQQIINSLYIYIDVKFNTDKLKTQYKSMIEKINYNL